MTRWDWLRDVPAFAWGCAALAGVIAGAFVRILWGEARVWLRRPCGKAHEGTGAVCARRRGHAGPVHCSDGEELAGGICWTDWIPLRRRKGGR